MASQKQPLTSYQNSPRKIRLYDEECTLDIDIREVGMQYARYKR